MVKDTGSLFTTAYLFLIFGIYPFYMKEGYVNIGEGKYEFFIQCSLGAAVILAVTGLICGIQVILKRYREKEAYLIDLSRVSLTDIFVILFVAEITLSDLFSDFKEEAVLGTAGWHIGLVLLVTLCVLYFAVSRLWDCSKTVWKVAATASFIVFLLGILDSFSFYVIPLEVREPGFISTMGNINWFCGYLSVLAPIGICVFFLQEQEKKYWQRLLWGLYTAVAFMAGLSQGGNSVFLWFFGLFFVLLWMCAESRKKLADWFFLVMLFGVSAQLLRLLKLFMPDAYNYEQDNLCGYFTGNSITLFIAVLAAVGYGVLTFMETKAIKEKESAARRRRSCLLVLLAGGVAGYLILAFINTYTKAGGFLDSQLFLWDEGWGHGRGAAFKAAFAMFREMPLHNKLLGVGTDCFAAYAYSLDEVAADLRNYFGSSRLTNAHNELVTSLINTGILGTLCYAGMFVSFIVRSFMSPKRDAFIKTAGICVCCYLVHNMVSFAQVLNLPFVILIMAMGERMIREKGEENGVEVKQEH